MPPKKGVSAEDKRERMLNLIRSSNTCWLIKVRVRYPRYQCAHQGFGVLTTTGDVTGPGEGRRQARRDFAVRQGRGAGTTRLVSSLPH